MLTISGPSCIGNNPALTPALIFRFLTPVQQPLMIHNIMCHVILYTFHNKESPRIHTGLIRCARIDYRATANMIRQ